MLTLKNNDYLKKYVEINFIKIATEFEGVHNHTYT